MQILFAKKWVFFTGIDRLIDKWQAFVIMLCVGRNRLFQWNGYFLFSTLVAFSLHNFVNFRPIFLKYDMKHPNKLFSKCATYHFLIFTEKNSVRLKKKFSKLFVQSVIFVSNFWQNQGVHFRDRVSKRRPDTPLPNTMAGNEPSGQFNWIGLISQSCELFWYHNHV